MSDDASNKRLSKIEKKALQNVKKFELEQKKEQKKEQQKENKAEKKEKKLAELEKEKKEKQEKLKKKNQEDDEEDEEEAKESQSKVDQSQGSISEEKKKSEGEEDIFLTSLIETEQIEPTVKAVFESGNEKLMSQKLDVLIKAKEKEIEDITNAKEKYTAFISAVDELMQVKGQTNELKQRLLELNLKAQKSGQKIMEKYKKLIELRKTLWNISQAKETVSELQYLLLMIVKVNQSHNQTDFLFALKTLEHMGKVNLPHFQQSAIGKYIQSSIPVWKEKIRKGARTEFDDFFISLREKMGDIGQIVMDPNLRELRSQHKFVTTSEEDWFNNSKFVVRFSSLHQCLAVYTELGMLDTFKTFYRESRTRQAAFVMKLGGRNDYRQYIYQICGFFVVEDKIRNSTNLVDPVLVEKLWQQAISKIKGLLQEQMSLTLDPNTIIEMKEFVMAFAKTLQILQYNVDHVLDFVPHIKDTFAQLAINSTNMKFINAIHRDLWSPLEVTNYQDYQKWILQTRLLDTIQTKESKKQQEQSDQPTLPKFPMIMPFSMLVVEYTTLVSQFIESFYDFERGLTEGDDDVKRFTEGLIGQFNQEVLSQPNLSTAQLVQSWANFATLEKVVKEWDHIVIRRSNYGRPLTHSFDKCKMQVEALIVQSMKQKVQSFISLSETSANWLATASRPEPRDYARDLRLYLASSFPLLQPLSQPVRENIQMKSLAAVSNGILDLLADKIPSFTFSAIKNLDSDLRVIEDFCDTSLKIANPRDFLVELRQTINLIVSPDGAKEFLDPAQRKVKYYRLYDFNRLIKILEKSRDDQKFLMKSAKEKDIQGLVVFMRKEKEKTNP